MCRSDPDVSLALEAWQAYDGLGSPPKILPLAEPQKMTSFFKPAPSEPAAAPLSPPQTLQPPDTASASASASDLAASAAGSLPYPVSQLLPPTNTFPGSAEPGSGPPASPLQPGQALGSSQSPAASPPPYKRSRITSPGSCAAAADPDGPARPSQAAEALQVQHPAGLLCFNIVRTTGSNSAPEQLGGKCTIEAVLFASCMQYRY